MPCNSKAVSAFCVCGFCSVALLGSIIGAAILGGALSGFTLLAERVQNTLPANCSMSSAQGAASGTPDYCGDDKCRSWEKTENLNEQIHQGGNKEIGEPFDCELKSSSEGTYTYSCLCEAKSEYRSTDEETHYNPPLEFSFIPTSLPDVRSQESMLEDCAFTRIREYTMDTGVNQSGIGCFYVPEGVHEAEHDGEKIRYELPPMFVLGWEQDEALEHLSQVYDTLEGIQIGLICGIILTCLCSCCSGIGGCVLYKQQLPAAEQSLGDGQQPPQVMGQYGQQPPGVGQPGVPTAYGDQTTGMAYGGAAYGTVLQATAVQQPAGYGQPGSGY